MHYHIILTEKCNSQCRYCYEKSMKEFDNSLSKKFKFDFSAPCDSEIDLEKLKKFVKSEDILIFYGGEPLINIKKMKEIMDALPENKFCMQTNGKLLNKVPKNCMNKFSKILVSIDGDKERTDFNKGGGTYDLVLKNIDLIRKNGFKGEIVARMTISEFPDIYEQVKHLIGLKKFNSVHWQLDAGFYNFDFNFEEFSKFAEEYDKDVSKLIDFWIKEMKNGKVLRLYPFLGIFEDLYCEKTTKLRCGAGYAGYAIDTRGKIIACPIMNCITNFEAGNLDTNPNKLKKFNIENPECKKCSYFVLCGGRCLYWREADLWPKQGNELICKTIKHLIDELKKRTPEIRELIKKKIISEKDFEYERYFGPEIIP